MKKNTIIVLALLFSFAFVGFAPATSTSQGTDVKIGLLTPLTGALGSLGPTFENGANLAIEDLNAATSDFTFSLEVQDTKTDPTGASDAMTALAQAGVVGVVGAASSASTLAAMPTARENQIPMISYASTAPSISTSDDGDFLFRVVPSDAFQGQAAAQLAYTELGLNNIAVIGLNDAYGQGLAGAFINAYEAKGGTVTDNIGYEVTNQDFTSQVSQIASSSPDGIFMVSFVDDGALLLDAIAAESSLSEVQIIGTDGIASSEMFGTVSNTNSFNNTQGVAPQIASSETFANRYLAEYGVETSVFVEHAYDATMTIGHALIAAGEATSCLVADNIRGAVDDFTPVTGAIEFDGNGDRAPPAAYDFWNADAVNSTHGVIDSYDSFTVTGEGASGTGPATHCTEEGGFLPFSFLPFLFGFVVVAVWAKRKQ